MNDSPVWMTRDSIKQLGYSTTDFLSYMASKYYKLKREGRLTDDFFHVSIVQIKKESSVPHHLQIIATERLKKLGILKVKKVKSVPPKNWYSINEEELKRQFPLLVNLIKPKFERGD